MILLLGLVVSPLGSNANGAQSWYGLGGFQLQPSEISKVALIMSLGRACWPAWKGEIDLRRLAIALVVAGLPMALIMLQPDLGTALVFISISAAMLCVGGVRGRYLAVLALVAIIGVVGILKSNTLAQYQKDRLTEFVDPSNNTRRRLQRQPEPDGHRQRPHHRRRAVPGAPDPPRLRARAADRLHLHRPRRAVRPGRRLACCWGCSRSWSGGSGAPPAWPGTCYGTLLCVGVLAMLVFQIFESMGMTMGIMPVTGIPLPFMSYGGSSTVACFVGIGLVLNVHMHRFVDLRSVTSLRSGFAHPGVIVRAARPAPPRAWSAERAVGRSGDERPKPVGWR